ncbi:hypothetical protein PQX77_008119 [Marasmius sp. AFHP31]|nr:hypothetical protein PQX77_008119 [Marasmius sp. AFHP31]
MCKDAYICSNATSVPVAHLSSHVQRETICQGNIDAQQRRDSAPAIQGLASNGPAARDSTGTKLYVQIYKNALHQSSLGIMGLPPVPNHLNTSAVSSATSGYNNNHAHYAQEENQFHSVAQTAIGGAMSGYGMGIKAVLRMYDERNKPVTIGVCLSKYIVL